MKTTRSSQVPEGRGAMRALVHRGVRSSKASPVALRAKRVADDSMCERCGNVYRDKRWLASSAGERSWPIGFAWTICPACRQVEAGEFFGRLVIRGRKALRDEDALRERIGNVAARARFTQPQRRVLSIERLGDTIEVLTTSQKLAHRIAAALHDAFGGDVTFTWASNDGELRATWTWDEVAVRRGAKAVPAGGVRRVPARARAEIVREAARAVGKTIPDLEIQGRRADVDPALRGRVERRVKAWGERFPELTRVHVTFTHGRHHRHGAEEVTANARMSGRALYVAKREETMAAALRETLGAMERELRTLNEERRNVTKPPGGRAIGSVKRIWRDAGYGFIRLDHGREAYFHRDSLHGLTFRALVPGTPVEVELEQGEEGLQAARVFPVGQRNRV